MCFFTEHVSCAPQGIIGGIMAIVLSKNKKSRILVNLKLFPSVQHSHVSFAGSC